MVGGLVFSYSLAVVLAANCVNFFTERSARDAVTNVSCTTDMDCIAQNSACYQRMFCACNDGYVPINKTMRNNFQCVKAATKEGDLCIHDLQCEHALGIHGQCVMYREGSPGEGFGSCHCKPQHHLVGKLCHPDSYIGDACRVSDDCYLKTNDPSIRAYCDRSKCICPPGRHPSPDRKECLANEVICPGEKLTEYVVTSDGNTPSVLVPPEKCSKNFMCDSCTYIGGLCLFVGIDGPCDDEDDCIFPHTRCGGAGYCNCDEGYVMNEGRTACEADDLIPIVRLGDPCKNNSQCSVFLKETMCHPISKTCTCSIGAQQINDTCYRIARLGDRCYERLECVAPSGEGRTDCIGTVCSCVSPYIAQNHDCLLKSEMHGSASSPKLHLAALTLISWLFIL